MHSNNRKYFWNIVLILTVTVIAMYFALRDNFKEIMHALGQINFFSLLAILAWGLTINVVIGVGLMFLGRRYQKHYSLQDGIIVAFVGTFFAGITPSSTGGQFGQVYVLKKQGINMSDGVSLLWADFIIYQTTMMIYVTVLFILRFSHYVNLNAWFWIVFGGYLINIVVIVGLYTIALFPNLYIKLCRWTVNVLGKMHLIKDPEHKMKQWVAKMTSFTGEVKLLSQDKRLIIQLMLVNFVRLTLYYALPYAVALALGIRLNFGQFVDTLALSSFVTMANCFVPLPGASGGTEVFFTMLFSGLFGPLTGAVLLLWRFSSYYLPVIAGALVFMVFKNREDAKEDQASLAAKGQGIAPPMPPVGQVHEIEKVRPLQPDEVKELVPPKTSSKVDLNSKPSR